MSLDMSTLRRGAIAGGAGTTALNVVTYLDMTVRGRAASSVPEQMIAVTARALGADALGADDPPADVSNRREGLAALAGYVTGLGSGVAAALMERPLRRLPRPVAAAVVAGAVMAVSDGSLVASGVTKPSEWGVAGWLSDIIPHLVYGYVVLAALDHLVD
jgi:hypothetical protein